MKKFAFFISIILGLLLRIQQAASDMPMYGDDEEFKHCTQVTQDWDNCVREEMLRSLDQVKRLYRDVMGVPAILKWHEKPDETVQVMHDMYESWTAFRNRLCMLSYRASAYIEPLVDERYACNLYYTQHHKDHMNSILQLIKGETPDKRADFNFLTPNSHDEKYEECLKKNENKRCIEEELKRSSKTIKDLYKSFIEDEFVGKWNNGPSLKQGNYRDMYDSWIAYRNRICKLAIWAYQYKYGDEAPENDQCLLFFNNEKIEAMSNLLVVAHSSLDEGIEEEEEPGVSEEFAGNAPELGNDGGEAIGKTIPPLQKRIDSGSDSSDDELVTDYKQDDSPKEEIKTDNGQPNKNIPSWAQQK